MVDSASVSITWSYEGERLDAPGMGTFEVVGEKIIAWRDYFSIDGH